MNNTVYVLKRTHANTNEFVTVSKDETELILRAVEELLKRKVEGITIDRNDKEIGLNFSPNTTTFIGTNNKLEFEVSIHKI